MILKHELKTVKISDIKLDPANPNKMSDQQLEALRYSLKKFGQLKPPVIDQTLTVCDGEHQIRAYMAENVEEIQVFQVECTPAQRRLIRQTMNKLHGIHDPSLDVEEFLSIKQDNELAELSKLLAIEEADFEKMMIQERFTDKDDNKDRLDSYLFGNVKQIVLYFDNAKYDEVLAKFEALLKSMGVESNTEVVIKLLEHYESCNTKKA